jgi:hypothetical protein
MGIRKSKERGEWAELIFMAKTAGLGLKPSKPWGDSAPYDVTLEHAGRFIRVQVKCTFCRATRKKPHPRPKGVFVANMRHIWVRRYQPSDFDYVAVYVIPKDVWYIIPSAVATRRVAIRIAPGNPDNQYERYREAWHLLRDLKTARSFTLHAMTEDPPVPLSGAPGIFPLSS